jgi:hypothetical protein
MKRERETKAEVHDIGCWVKKSQAVLKLVFMFC